MSNLGQNSYKPRQTGIIKDQRAFIEYKETPPSDALRDVVYCYWTLKTSVPLSNDLKYSVMPDACIDFVFDLTRHTKPLIMTPHLHIETLNLGKEFFFSGIRFKPGVFTSKALRLDDIIGKQHPIHTVSTLESIVMSKLPTLDANGHIHAFEVIVATLQHQGFIERNLFIEGVLSDMQRGLSIDDVAKTSGYSTRQLRRKIMLQTGFSPIQLQRVVRFQQALSQHDITLRFADQSHLIKEFKAITGASHKAFMTAFK